MNPFAPRTLGRRIRHAWIGARLAGLGRDAFVARGACLEQPGRIHIGPSARVEHGAVLRANSEQPAALRLGRGASVKEYAVVNANGGRIEIGAASWIGPHCVLYGNGGITIGAGVLIAAHTTISSVSHEHGRTDVPITDQGLTLAPVIIEDDVWIGLNCTIVPGVRIGRGCVIGAGAVVNRDLPAFSIAVGVPARVVGSRLATQSAMQALARAAS